MECRQADPVGQRLVGSGKGPGPRPVLASVWPTTARPRAGGAPCRPVFASVQW